MIFQNLGKIVRMKTTTQSRPSMLRVLRLLLPPTFCEKRYAVGCGETTMLSSKPVYRIGGSKPHAVACNEQLYNKAETAEYDPSN
jgi:hypothetical protein